MEPLIVDLLKYTVDHKRPSDEDIDLASVLKDKVEKVKTSRARLDEETRRQNEYRLAQLEGRFKDIIYDWLQKGSAELVVTVHPEAVWTDEVKLQYIDVAKKVAEAYQVDGLGVILVDSKKSHPEECLCLTFVTVF
jgi:hypothetical protein